MSYCRFSSMNWLCDVYVYESGWGWQLHIAGLRRKEANPYSDNLRYLLKDSKDYNPLIFKEMHKKEMEWLDKTELEPIGLPEDGNDYSFRTPGECADKLEELIKMGYNVPQYAIDNLREDQKEMNND